MLGVKGWFRSYSTLQNEDLLGNDMHTQDARSSKTDETSHDTQPFLLFFSCESMLFGPSYMLASNRVVKVLQRNTDR